MHKHLQNIRQKDFETSIDIFDILIKKKNYAAFSTSDLKYEDYSFVYLQISNNSLLQYLKFIVNNNAINSFPESCGSFKLFPTIPVSGAITKRVTSSLKRTKEHSHSTLTKKPSNQCTTPLPLHGKISYKFS